MAAPTAGWLVYPPKGELQAVAQRVVCWARHDKRVQVGTWGGTHLIIPFDLCQSIGQPLVLTPGGTQFACQAGNTPTGWVTVSNLTDADVSGINPNSCAEVPAPAGLTVGTETAATAPLTWTASAGASGYLVRWRQQGSTGAWGQTLVTAPAYTITGLTAATTYDVTVQAVVGGFLSAKATATATTTS
jgi:hypothetical protein